MSGFFNNTELKIRKKKIKVYDPINKEFIGYTYKKIKEVSIKND